MATKKPETAKQMRERHFETLLRAVKVAQGCEPDGPSSGQLVVEAGDYYRVVRAAVKAAYPGRQRNAKLVRELDAAVKAVARVIRRRG